jgi:magnesium transporter
MSVAYFGCRTGSSESLANQVRGISAWVAILIVPTIISGIYGMNYQHMPELTWQFGYPYALILMVAICVGLYLAFKRAKWL